MHKFTLNLALLLLILFATNAEDVPPPIVTCGECSCSVSPCSPLPPPLIPYLYPPPPRFVYVTELSPPPPPRFVFTTGSPDDLYGSNPFDWEIYSSAPHISHKIDIFILMVLLFSTFQSLQPWWLHSILRVVYKCLYLFGVGMLLNKDSLVIRWDPLLFWWVLISFLSYYKETTTSILCRTFGPWTCPFSTSPPPHGGR